jgi:hypothetical protein
MGLWGGMVARKSPTTELGPMTPVPDGWGPPQGQRCGNIETRTTCCALMVQAVLVGGSIERYCRRN